MAEPSLGRQRNEFLQESVRIQSRRNWMSVAAAGALGLLTVPDWHHIFSSERDANGAEHDTGKTKEGPKATRSDLKNAF